MTIEEVLISVGKECYKRSTGEDRPVGYWGYAHNTAIEAMEEWAKLESERFLKWVQEGHFCPNSSGFWFDYTASREDVRFYTIAQLYGWFHTGIKFTLPPVELPKSIQEPKKVCDTPLPSWITDKGNGYYTVDIDAAKAAGENLPLELGKIPQFADFFTDPPTRTGTIDFKTGQHHCEVYKNETENNQP